MLGRRSRRWGRCWSSSARACWPPPSEATSPPTGAPPTPTPNPPSELLARIRQERRQKWEQSELAKYKAKDKQPPKGWQEKYEEPEPVDESELPELPNGWCWATFDTFIEFVTSGSRGWAKHYSKTGSLFVRSQNINTDSLVLDDVAHVSPPSGSEGSRTRILEFDLLVTITGANVAKAAFVDIPIDEAYVSQHVALARPVDPTLSAYLHLWTVSPDNGRSQLLAEAYGNGKPGLNLDNLKQMRVAVAPFHEQVAILKIIQNSASGIEAISAAASESESALTQLDQSILAKAFRGELVPQDPSDEPASVLLQRIRAAREATESNRVSNRDARKRKLKPNG
jgi:type I restriction enzyme, S subunit